MKLTCLRLHGFKSFADRTEIEFHDGITAIVGPNGCGKSNISDAIRWVLGEQRPTAIRGAKMEEAIFQGTISRRPVHRGSVSMEISNEANVLPVPFEEVEINRTVYRDGGSQYELNRSACRLRDIQDLCRDTGLGANAYAVIENRMIDAILSDRADERRGLFEEAAGIGKYKDRRKTASRRLERAEIDVQRLDDLLSEVESKVRSLARQKGRAERYGELRKRRLDVEVTVVARESGELEDRLSRLRGELDGGVRAGESLDAELSTAEARVESLRLEQVEAERGRGEAAARVEELRTRLVEWERELAVAGERGSYAARRLEQIDGERRESREQVEHAEAEGGELEKQETERTAALDALRADVAEQRVKAEEVRRRLLSAREGMDEVASREREVARRVAQLHGDAEAADGQGRDLELRLEHLEGELAEARAGLAELRSQGDLFENRLQDLEVELSSARAEVEAAEARVNDAREAEDAAREAELAAQDHAGTLETRLEALERMDRDREGMDPVLDSLLGDPPPGVVGILADFISADLEVMAAVEAYLGVTSRAVVVRDVESARGVARWFGEEWSGGGGLVLLPLDRAPAGTPSGSLLERIEASGEGAPWVAALLDGVSFEEEGWPAATAAANGGGDSVAPDGAIRSGRGVLRVGNPLGATGLLERKEELRTLRLDAAAARERADELREARVTARERLREAEEALETAREALREREDGQRAARAEESERTHRRTRMERALEDLERQKEAARTGRVRAKERAQAAREELETLSGEEEILRARRAEAREALERVQEEWEEARGRVSDLTVEEARREGEVERIVERRQELTRRAEAARERLEGLDREESELREELARVRELREEGEGETRRLLELRGEATDRLKERDAALETLQETLAGAERQVRDLRSAERKASEDRHRIELEVRELEGKAARIRERLESEWGRSLETLTAEADPVEGEPEELKEELAEIVQRLERLGPVNMLAVEEHEEESARLTFLKEQRGDLVEARDDLRSAIREINQTATRLFVETFEGIRENFRDTFHRLFEGGECDVWLEDPADPLESAIEIQASPRGKRTQRIDLLSGGERALTALSLLFGIYLVKPSPFCVLDEVDAPLDESNIGRFIRLLQEFKHQTQFIVITHNPRTIEAADWIYGVTMEEPGVSSIVGVRLEEALEATAV